MRLASILHVRKTQSQTSCVGECQPARPMASTVTWWPEVRAYLSKRFYSAHQLRECETSPSSACSWKARRPVRFAQTRGAPMVKFVTSAWSLRLCPNYDCPGIKEKKATPRRRHRRVLRHQIRKAAAKVNDGASRCTVFRRPLQRPLHTYFYPFLSTFHVEMRKETFRIHGEAQSACIVR